MNNSLPPLFYKTYRSVHQHEGRTAAKSITAGGVAIQDSATEEAKGRAVHQSVKEHWTILLLFSNKQLQCILFVGDNHFKNFLFFNSFLSNFKALQAKFFCFHSFLNFKAFSQFIFSKPKNLYDQILDQIWSQGGGACSGVTTQYCCTSIQWTKV